MRCAVINKLRRASVLSVVYTCRKSPIIIYPAKYHVRIHGAPVVLYPKLRSILYLACAAAHSANFLYSAYPMAHFFP